MEKLDISIGDIDDVDLDDEDELRTYIYDEEIMELWLKKYPEEVMKLKPPPPPPPPPPPSPPSADEETKSSSDTSDTKGDQKSTNKFENFMQSGSNFIKNLWGGKKDEL